MLFGPHVVGRRRAVWIAIGGIVPCTLLVRADVAVVWAAIMPAGHLYPYRPLALLDGIG
jgi:hypothetical protein